MVLTMGIFKIESEQNHTKKKVNMTRKCHNHTLQTNPTHHEEKAQNTNSQLKESNQLHVPQRDDCTTRNETK